MKRTALSIILVTGLAFTGCATTSPAGNSPVVVATTTMLGSVAGDITECAGGTAVTLMPVGVDPHDFSASSEQIAQMVRAQLVVSNGLGLEEGLADAISGAQTEGALVMEVAPLVNPIPFGEGRSTGSAEARSLDPHFWNDVSRMAEAATLVGEKLAEVTGHNRYADCGGEVHDALMKVDNEVQTILAAVPAERRLLVTVHDAFGYFAEVYDFDIAGVIIPGGSTLAEPSSKELAALVNTIKVKNVSAIFSDIAASRTLADTVAAEAGAGVDVVELFVGSLGPEGSGAESYSGMMLTNARLIADALG